jgi:hypothetical protein
MITQFLFKPSPEVLEQFTEDIADALFNMSGDYSYMSEGYYETLDAELEHLRVFPTTTDALDAYIVPIAMEKAKLHGLSTPDYDIMVDKLVPPVLAYPVNPFSTKYQLVMAGDDLDTKLKTLTSNGKYATICQRLPSDYRIDVVRCILGKSLTEEYASFSLKLFDVFKLPLMRARVLVTSSDYLLSAIEPLPFDDLTLNEKKLLDGAGTWQS